MNEDVLKPFPCKEIGCGMGFFTEDHLTVHYQAKHSKLNLEIPKGSSVQIYSDQTPTPTRLLNNCEALRVFDDLQNINPFEEGFRKATEDISNGIIPESHFLSTPSNQDTLHTPQILPQFDPRSVKSEYPVQEEPENLTVPSTPEDLSNIPKTPRETESNGNDLNVHQKLTQPPIPLLPKPSIIYAAPIISAPAAFNLSANISQDDVKSESVKDKLKNILLSNPTTAFDKNKRIKTEHIPAIYIGAVPLVAAPANLVIKNSSNKLKVASNQAIDEESSPVKTNESDSGSRKRTKGEKTDASSLKVERNRAAARRYRTKMKIQSQALQEKYDKSQREISSLKKELTELKKELTQVKALLLLHKDCPVSHAMTTSGST